MRKHTIFTMVAFGCTVAGLLAGTAAAEAKIIPFTISLDSKNEVPPANAHATGKGTARYDTVTMELTYRVSYSGLTGEPIMAHFHGPAAPGVNAGVAVPVPKGSSGLANPIVGSATLTEAQAADLMAGKYYFNIHTDANKGGELRGQVVPAKGGMKPDAMKKM